MTGWAQADAERQEEEAEHQHLAPAGNDAAAESEDLYAALFEAEIARRKAAEEQPPTPA